MELQRLRTDVVNNISSLLCATKGAITTAQLNEDYYAVLNSNIPFRKLGYNSLDDFIKSLHDVVKCSVIKGQLYVEMIPQQSTSHIFKLVQGQRRAKGKPPPFRITTQTQSRGGRSGPLLRTPPLQPAIPLMGHSVTPYHFEAPPRMRSVVHLPPTSTIRPNIPYQTSMPQLTRRVILVNKPNSREKLEAMAREHKLGEVTYSQSKTKAGTFVGKVAVGKSSYTSYPKEFKNPEDAHEQAAKEAVESLQDKYKSTAFPETKDVNLMAERVVDIVKDKPRGLWGQRVQEIYSELHQESLPTDWVNLVSGVTNKIVLENPHNMDYLLYPNKMLEQAATSCRPVPMSFPENEEYLAVHVIVVFSLECIAVRLVNSEQYQQWDDMMNNLELFYTDKESSLKAVDKPNRDTLYLAQIDKSWCRVIVDELVEPNQVRVVLVDYSDVETIPRDQLFPLEPKFCPIPCQGLKCRLYGLDKLGEVDVASMGVRNLADGHYDAFVVSRDPDVSLLLYKSDEGVNINMNELILSEIAENLPAPSLQVGALIPVTVRYISSTGDVFVSTNSPQQRVVEALISLLCLNVDNIPTVSTGSILPGAKPFLARSTTRGCYCRVVIYSTPTSDGSVAAHLMDYGDTEILSVNDIKDLSSSCPILARLSPQAIKVRLDRIPPSPTLAFTEKAAQKLRELVPSDSQLLLRTVDIPFNGIPIVELYERLPSSKLIFINTTLEMEKSLFRPISGYRTPSPLPIGPEMTLSALTRKFSATSMGSRSRSTSLSSPSPSPSPPPQQISPVIPGAKIPQKNSDFQVKVFNVSNPKSFYVQPLETYPILSKLMHSLEELYGGELGKAQLPKQSIVINGCYAAFDNKTKLYYRAVVQHQFGDDFLVHFVDFGDNEIVKMSDLRSLPKEFTELPAQALKATLAGVEPINRDWSVEAALFFKEHVDGKYLFSHVIDVGEDNTLSLHLINTSGNEDVEIDKLLINNGHAMAA